MYIRGLIKHQELFTDNVLNTINYNNDNQILSNLIYKYCIITYKDTNDCYKIKNFTTVRAR